MQGSWVQSLAGELSLFAGAAEAQMTLLRPDAAK